MFRHRHFLSDIFQDNVKLLLYLSSFVGGLRLPKLRECQKKF